MAKVNQAQEPSMEEILASIRRIISDDGDDAPLPGRSPSVISTEAIDALFGARGEDSDPIPSFLRQEPAAQPRAPRPEPRVDQPAARFEQPAARYEQPAARPEMRAPAEPRHAVDAKTPADARYPAEQRYPAEARPFAELKPRIEVARSDLGKSEPAKLDITRPNPVRVEAEAPRAEPLQPAAPQAQAAPVEPDAAPARQAAAIVPAEELPAGRPLLSAAADAAVSASFGGLASTLLSGNARTLEDLVKDMLRPMLKAWLDTNLPPLVERLVRDEIERVSRGR